MAIYLDRASAKKDGGPSARAVLRYNELIQQLADKAQLPGFTVADWDALGEVVAVEDFRRFGCFMETQDWQQYLAMMTGWATTTKFSSTFRRMTEEEGLVFLELQEDNAGEIANSLSVYEVDAAGKIVRLHIYLQRAI